MTRKQVAVRLGRSLATVRRLEGDELHPVVDASGVHRFDPREVEALAQRTVKPSSFLNAARADTPLLQQHNDGECTDCLRLHHRVRHLEAELDEVTRAHVVELNGVHSLHQVVIAKAAEEQRALEVALVELMEALED